MPRQRRSTAARSAVLSQPQRRSMVASATNYRKTPIASTAVATSGPNSSVKNPRKITAQDWQTTAWTFYDSIGEYRYACDWVGNLLSRVKLVVFKNGEPTTDAAAVDLLDALFGGPEGQADMLRQLGTHWTVAGDCYIIGDNVSDDPTSDDPTGDSAPDWLIGAATQTTQDNEGLWKVNTERFASNALVIRLWKPHPTDRTSSDSPSRAVLPILSEIDGLTKYVAAQVDSRLAGNGLLLIPDNITFGSATPESPLDDATGDPTPRRDAQAFAEMLVDVAGTAIADREDPNSLIPIVIQANGEDLQYVRHVAISTDLQTQAQELRREAIGRLALGMDMPPEILTGTSDMNHWSSWQIEEAAIKSHLEPLLDEICASLTKGYLQPVLETKGDDVYTIEADTTALRLRPNRSKEALELYNLGRLSGEALLRENGFDPKADLMGDDEFRKWLTTKVASGSASPEQVQAALEALGVQLKLAATGQAPDPNPTNSDKPAGTPRETRPTPTTKDHPVRQAPDTGNPGTGDAPTKDSAAGIDDRVVFAGAVMVDRALERAGNRIKSKIDAKIRDSGGSIVPAAQVYRFVKVDSSSSTLDDLLNDAWSPVGRWSKDLAVDSEWLTATLDGYTRRVLQHAQPHSARALRAYLDDAIADA